MDDDERLPQLLDSLTTQLESLSGTLEPLLSQPLSQTASKLPLLDGAKLNVLTAYTLYTLVFNTLKLNGIDAQAHPVYKELARVKEYFKRITNAEQQGPSNAGASVKHDPPTSRLDKEAAARFVRHGLAGNHSNQHQRFGNDDDIDAEAIQKRVDERQAAELKRQQRSKGKARVESRDTETQPGSDGPINVPQVSNEHLQSSKKRRGEEKKKKEKRERADAPSPTSRPHTEESESASTKRVKRIDQREGISDSITPFGQRLGEQRSNIHDEAQSESLLDQRERTGNIQAAREGIRNNENDRIIFGSTPNSGNRNPSGTMKDFQPILIDLDTYDPTSKASTKKEVIWGTVPPHVARNVPNPAEQAADIQNADQHDQSSRKSEVIFGTVAPYGKSNDSIQNAKDVAQNGPRKEIIWGTVPSKEKQRKCTHDEQQDHVDAKASKRKEVIWGTVPSKEKQGKRTHDEQRDHVDAQASKTKEVIWETVPDRQKRNDSSTAMNSHALLIDLETYEPAVRSQPPTTQKTVPTSQPTPAQVPESIHHTKKQRRRQRKLDRERAPRAAGDVMKDLVERGSKVRD